MKKIVFLSLSCSFHPNALSCHVHTYSWVAPMCACVFVCIYVWMSICMCVCMCLWKREGMYLCACVCVCLCLCICEYVCAYTCIWMPEFPTSMSFNLTHCYLSQFLVNRRSIGELMYTCLQTEWMPSFVPFQFSVPSLESNKSLVEINYWSLPLSFRVLETHPSGLYFESIPNSCLLLLWISVFQFVNF